MAVWIRERVGYRGWRIYVMIVVRSEVIGREEEEVVVIRGENAPAIQGMYAPEES